MRFQISDGTPVYVGGNDFGLVGHAQRFQLRTVLCRRRWVRQALFVSGGHGKPHIDNCTPQVILRWGERQRFTAIAGGKLLAYLRDFVA